MRPLCKTRHELYARNLIRHKGNQTKAYLEVYPNCSKASAPSKASRLVRNGNVIHRIQELLNPDEAMLRSVVKTLLQACEAKKALRMGKETILVSDHRSRLRAVQMILKLMAYSRGK